MKKLSILLILIASGCSMSITHDYSNIKVGKSYLIGKHQVIKADLGNPFDNPGPFIINPQNVVVEDLLYGYVKYCIKSDYGNPNHFSFSRSLEDFQSLINEAK